ncbi:FUSC family protein [Gordoniibacillus kamchatkensis]|uniref:FUSC family protein n=1 Tax=Gordoniibacillus kamchatkensis TaxID=1590651 RepID=UPI0006968FCB|nr:FUSC family protein [Paenibacillus sp. VKM B-2647]
MGKRIVSLIAMILKMSAASGIAWELAKLCGSKHPYLAPLSVILCLQTTVLQSVLYSFHRLFGTVVGVVLTVWAADYVPLNGWTLALLLVLVSGAALLLQRKESVVHEAALSVLLVLALQKQSPGHYGFDRIRDTIIGLAVGLAVHMLVYPPNLTKQAERAGLALAQRMAERFAQAAAWVQDGCRADRATILHAESQALHKELFQAHKQLEQAAKSLKLNWFAESSRSLLQASKRRAALLERGVLYLQRTVRIMAEWSSAGTLPPAEQERWASRLRSIGVCWSDLSRSKGIPFVSDPDLIALRDGADEPSPDARYTAMLHAGTSELLQELNRSS